MEERIPKSTAILPNTGFRRSRLRTFGAVSSMNSSAAARQHSPIRIVNILSASTALSSFKSTFRSLRFSGFIVVSNNSLAFISPRPLKRLICTPRRPISKIFSKNLRDRKQRMRNGLFAFAFDQLEDRPVAGRVVVDFQTFARPARQ